MGGWRASRSFMDGSSRVLCGAVLLLALLPGGTAAEPAAPGEIRLRVETPVYTLDAGGLRVPGYAADDTPGAPALPVWSAVVELPPDGAWQIATEAEGVRALRTGASLPAAPVPQFTPGGPQGAAALADLPAILPLADRPDPAIYGRDAFYPAAPVSAGPVQWQRGRRLLPVRAYPFQYNPATGALRYHPDLRITITMGPAEPGATRAEAANEMNLRLNAPGQLRIFTGAGGLYRLTYADLLAAGVPVTVTDPASLAMSHLGAPIDIEVTGAADGRLDPGDQVIFYAEPYVGRYMTRNVYWLAYGAAAAAPRMAARSAPPAAGEPPATIITRTLHIEYDRTYYSTYHLPRTADHWFDTPLYANVAAPTVSVTYALALDAPLPVGNLVLRAALHGGAARDETPDQSVALAFNGQAAGTFQWDGSVSHIVTATLPAAWLEGAANRVTLTAALAQLPALDGYWVSPDWVEVDYPARAEAAEDRLLIPAVAEETPEIVATGFTTDTVRAYDVSDPRHPVRLTGVAALPDGGNYAIRVGDAGAKARSYALSTDAALLAPAAIEPDTPSAWRAPDHAVDYIAIVHRSLWDAIQPLLDHRAAEGLRVAKVDVQDIYDEFSAGRVDPEALRTFLTYAYRHWNGGGAPPQYVLLVGDGHYDFRGVQRPDLPNLIPPYLVDIDPTIGETAADNRYVSVDGPDDYLPDMAIGRIPAKTPADVTAAVNKIIAYETAAPVGEWQRRVVFVADDYANDSGNFHVLSDETRLRWLPAGYRGQAIYYRMDAAHDTGEEMRVAIRGAFNQGALMIQWFGHASRARWGSVSMFDLLDPARLAPQTALPVTFSYSCWSGYFINLTGSKQYNYNEQALGEALLLTPGRGSVADLSPSGLHVGSALLLLNQGIVRALTRDRVARVGPLVDAGKQFYFAGATAWHDVIDTMVLFGDPATRLRLPPPAIYLPLAGPAEP